MRGTRTDPPDHTADTPRHVAVVLAVVVFAVVVPVAAVASGQMDRLYNALFFSVVAKRVIGSETDPVAMIERLEDFVHVNVRTPPGSPVIDGPPALSLIRGFAFCDPAVLTFLRLVATRDIPGHLVALLDEDGVSPHSVGEVYINGAWRVFDILYGFVPRRPDGEVATREDVVNTPSIIRVSRTSSEWYRQVRILVDTEDDFQSAGHLLGQEVMGTLATLAPAWVIDRLQDLYLAFATPDLPLDPLEADTAPGVSADERRLFFRARHYQAFLRANDAEAAYRELLRRYPHSVYADDAIFHLGVLQLTQRGDAAGALAMFAALAERYPESAWRADAEYFTAQAYERLGACEEAVARYRAIADDTTNATERARMALERLNCGSSAARDEAPRLILVERLGHDASLTRVALADLQRESVEAHALTGHPVQIGQVLDNENVVLQQNVVYRKGEAGRPQAGRKIGRNGVQANHLDPTLHEPARSFLGEVRVVVVVRRFELLPPARVNQDDLAATHLRLRKVVNGDRLAAGAGDRDNHGQPA